MSYISYRYGAVIASHATNDNLNNIVPVKKNKSNKVRRWTSQEKVKLKIRKGRRKKKAFVNISY